MGDVALAVIHAACVLIFRMTSQPQQDVCCLMGDPVAGNPAQFMLEKAFAVADLDWRFLTFEVSAGDFEAALAGVRIFAFRGVMLAAPHRGQVHRFLGTITDVARLSGQVNCLELVDGQLRGHNTDALALRKLVEGRQELKGVHAVILGAGRLAKSFAAELALAGAASIELVCVEPPQAEPLVAALRDEAKTASVEMRVTPWPQGTSLPISDACRLMVNATPVGRSDKDARLPIDVEKLPAGLLTVDATDNPITSRLVREVRKRGLPAIDGVELLVEQAAAAFEIWTRRQPDRDAMRDAAEEFSAL